MPKSSASETGSAGYVRTPWDEEESLVDFAKNAYETASSEAERNRSEADRSETVFGEAGEADLSTELEGALENQLRALDRNFLTPQRQHRSVFHELAVPPPRERSALPALPPPSYYQDAVATDVPTDDPWADEAEDSWAAEPAPAEGYGWPDRDPAPIYADDQARPYDDEYRHDDGEDPRAAAYWAEAWQRPSEAQATTRPRIALAPSMLVIAGLVAMAGGAGVAIGIQRVSTPDLAPITEANASVIAPNATLRPTTETVNAPQQATKLSYDRLDSVGPPLRASVMEIDRNQAPTRTSAVAVSPSEAAVLADSEPNDASSARATTLASASTATTEPADDIEDDTPTVDLAPKTTAKQTAQTNAFVNMRSKGESGAPTILVVPANATVDLFRCNGWCEIGYNGRRGFVYKTFLGGKPKAKPAKATVTASRATTPPITASTTASATAANTAPATASGTAAAGTTASAAGASPAKRWLDGLGFYR